MADTSGASGVGGAGGLDSTLTSDEKSGISELKGAFENAQAMAIATRKVVVQGQAELNADKKTPH
ncbi:hypothetical protein [Salinisphaera sp.]|uniref:hypothetical protein n=1 Tax=Salinisphaera sp. TaxID=1914330 RepID=UPI002D79C0B8|nr:hypothetical protein [Salinisphaera sp.]HET7314024.1 hypothetical protein [Salinisphaera sp.]